MKTKLLLLLAVLLPLAAHAATDLSTALQKGLFEEEANQNLPAAIQAYQSLLAASDDQRKLAATALFRLGECYRKLGQTNDAIAQYQRLIRDFTDQTTLATLSRQNLVGLGVGPAPVPAVSMSSTVVSSTSIEAQELARTERILAQLSGLDFSQARRLLPTLVPDADSERYEKLLVDAQERAEQATSEERERWVTKLDQFRSRLMQRFDEIEQTLEKRVAQLRSKVAKQSAQTSRETSAAGAAQAATAGLRAEAVRADALLKQLQSMNRSEVIRVLPTVAPDELLNSLLEKRAQAERNLATLKVSFASTHPDVKAAEATLTNLNMQITERVDGIMQGLAINAAALKAQSRTEP